MRYRTKLKKAKELSKKCSDRSKRGWKTRRIRMEAAADQFTSADDCFERAKADRKGRLYDVWCKTGEIRIEIYHSVDGRSDQYDVVICAPSENKLAKALSMPKVLKLWETL